MPRPRFDRLPAAKRERILEAAAQEFVAHGYESASLNRILESAEISKGAAYYYFDDKADLFATTVAYYSQQLLDDLPFDPKQMTAGNFWAEIEALYLHQFTSYAERPWVFGLAKAGGSPQAGIPDEGPLAEMLAQAELLLMQLIRHGRELGVVRDDLQDELLLSLVVAVDDAHDRWLLSRWAELAPADRDRAAARMANTLRRILTPEPS